MKTSLEFHKPHALVVEGRDDLWVCVQLLADLGIESVQVVEIGGFNNLAEALNLYTKTPGWTSVERLAVLVDCDGDAASRAASVKGALRKAKLTEPTQAGVFSGAEPAVAYCIVPADGGCLEDLIQEALATTGAIPACVDRFIECCGLQQDQSSKRQKAWVHAYIATMEPGMKVGEAARAGILRLEATAYDPLRSLLQALVATTEAEQA